MKAFLKVLAVVAVIVLLLIAAATTIVCTLLLTGWGNGFLSIGATLIAFIFSLAVVVTVGPKIMDFLDLDL